MIRRNLSSRMEREARDRRRRAQAHLERVRGRPTRSVAAAAGWTRLPTSRLGLAGALLAGALGGWLWGDDAVMALGAQDVATIAVRGARRMSVADVATATGLAPGTRLRDVSASDVAAQLESHAWIASAEAVRLPTGAVVVEIQERTPLAAIALGTPPTPYAVDASGAPFSAVDAKTLTGLPRLRSATPVAAREPNPQLAEAVRLAYRLPALGLALPDEVSVSAETDPEGFALHFASLSPRFVLGRDALDDRIEQLARLLARRPDTVLEAASVDLRFADQVVLRNAPPPEGAAKVPGGHPAPKPRGSAG
jgi:cell division septal protein FtsQ